LTNIGDDLAEVDSVSFGEEIAAVNLHFIGVEWEGICHYSSLCPLAWFSWFRGVLNGHIITSFEGRERFRARSKLLSFKNMSLGICFLTLISF
jgi:hypothetical protein